MLATAGFYTHETYVTTKKLLLATEQVYYNSILHLYDRWHLDRQTFAVRMQEYIQELTFSNIILPICLKQHIRYDHPSFHGNSKQ